MINLSGDIYIYIYKGLIKTWKLHKVMLDTLRGNGQNEKRKKILELMTIEKTKSFIERLED